MRGEWEQLGDTGAWLGLTAATVHQGIIYAVADRGLYRVRASDGAWSAVGVGDAASATWDTRMLASAGGALVALEHSGALYRIETEPTLDGAWSELVGDWSGTVAMTGLGPSLYAVDHSALWRADPASGEAMQMSADNWSTRLLSSAGPQLAAIEASGTLYRVNPADGEATAITVDAHWGGAEAMTGAGNRLWIADHGSLWMVHPIEGTWERLITDGEADFHPRLLLAIPGNDQTLYSFERTGALYRIRILPD